MYRSANPPNAKRPPRQKRTANATASGPREKPLPPFLTKLYDMVDDRSTDHIISWGPTGESFIVHKPGLTFFALAFLFAICELFSPFFFSFCL
jgi:hypothetical protein